MILPRREIERLQGVEDADDDLVLWQFLGNSDFREANKTTYQRMNARRGPVRCGAASP